MNSYKSSLSNCKVYLIFLATIALPALSNAETYNFKVVYANVSGIAEIRAGNHDAAIEILEGRAKDTDAYHVPDELATLCALYIMKGRLSAASVTCHDAVETDGSDAAYNNRGVFRAHLGDTAGAMEDFARVRILADNRQRYIEELMRGDARLVASGNYAVATKYSETHVRPMQALVRRVRGASVEDLGN